MINQKECKKVRKGSLLFKLLSRDMKTEAKQRPINKQS